MTDLIRLFSVYTSLESNGVKVVSGNLDGMPVRIMRVYHARPGHVTTHHFTLEGEEISPDVVRANDKHLRISLN